MTTAQPWIKKTLKDLHIATAEPGGPALEDFRSQIERCKLLDQMQATRALINEEAGRMILDEQLYQQPQYLVCAYTFEKPRMNYKMALVLDESGPRLVFCLHNPDRAAGRYAIQGFYPLFAYSSHHFGYPRHWGIKHQLRVYPATVNHLDLQGWFTYLLSGLHNSRKPLAKNGLVPRLN